ncbi:hypothetical protein PFISCL1PPCAC_23039, partial [Pristionchus fissidentatus]
MRVVARFHIDISIWINDHRLLRLPLVRVLHAEGVGRVVGEGARRTRRSNGQRRSEQQCALHLQGGLESADHLSSCKVEFPLRFLMNTSVLQDAHEFLVHSNALPHLSLLALLHFRRCEWCIGAVEEAQIDWMTTRKTWSRLK